MVAVALAALDFGVIRALAPSWDGLGGFLILGALPMLNVLLFGLLIAGQRPTSRPFFLGFEVFGAAALALYVVLLSGFLEEVLIPYLSLFDNLLDKPLVGYGPIVFVLVGNSVIVLALSLPQIALALLVGFLARRYKITITRR
jgi:hypothetical protein